MQMFTSKAYYLKNYIPKRKKMQAKIKTQPTNRLPSLSKHKSSNMQDLQIHKLNQARKISQHSHQNSQYSNSAHSTNSFVQHTTSSHPNTKYKDFRNIVEKEKDILRKVVEQKLHQTRSKRMHTVSGNDYVIVEKHPLSDVNTIEVETMKPTQRYFHMMNNVKLAQKLLLSKPSMDCSTRHCKEFYHKQNQYKSNISKLGFRSKKECQLSRLKLLNRRKWLD